MHLSRGQKVTGLVCDPGSAIEAFQWHSPTDLLVLVDISVHPLCQGQLSELILIMLLKMSVLFAHFFF